MEKKLVLPTPEQVEWSDCELGVIIHLDLPIFAHPYDTAKHFGDPLPLSVFTPDNLDTDQWIASAKAMGAKYAVLVAKHGTGFSLWPTDAHDYSVKNTSYKDGKGDIVGEFFASCKKYGLRPGLYYNASYNQLLNVQYGRVRDNDAEKQKIYNDIVIQQLTELWTRYGDVFELWFDGGVIPAELGGPDVIPLLHRLQPNAVVFQGPVGTKSLLRWVGNERGIAAENCSAIFSAQSQLNDGTMDCSDYGNPDGDIWCPAESDLPNRDARTSSHGGWLWAADEEHTIIPAAHLFETYVKSVGRNTNMLLGMVIDTHGQFPAPDAAVFAEFGDMVRKVFGTPLASAAAADGLCQPVICPDCGKEIYSVSLSAEENRTAGYLAIGENIAAGERVSGFTVNAYNKEGAEVYSYSGTIIGHKRILELPADAVKATVEITSSKAEPQILFLNLYGCLE